ncbi:hypothetical protein CBP51_03090 [Cellvibrio mixtus]|uniref:Uncharacterized protein n=1 Tax=Cellvibrio mixtus TaxID=39650 RepID=A0A266Q882_9GAMM|nr:type II toxin-antitoxin system PemK/MazF family toxin [Cellvibrio mixtus]OZY86030.1 hypothetical protein CBP51_03090 [Cellvibrio mixtus]
MDITYRLNSDKSILGSETLSKIDETAFPDTNYFTNPITITKKFSSHDGYRWLVKSVQHPSKKEILIDLEERTPSIKEVFLSQTYKKNSSVISRLQIGVLVEVEHGYYTSIKKINGDIKSSKRYPDLRQSGEMHKRRLAIVVNATNKFIQVVPITSQAPLDNRDKSIFKISPDSLKDLMDYNQAGKESFALGSMIQSVSLSRVLPPLAKSKSNKTVISERSVGYPHRLTGADRKLLESALSIAVKLGDYSENKKKLDEEFKKNKKKDDEINLLKSQLAERESEIETLTSESKRHEAIMIIIEDHYRQIHTNKSKDELLKFIEDEIQTNMEILRG